MLIVIGWQTRLAALALALFTAVAAYFFHDFWHYPAGAEYTNNMIHFMKNMSIIGGFLVLSAVGGGRYSLDGPCIQPEYLKRSQEPLWMIRQSRSGVAGISICLTPNSDKRVDQCVDHGGQTRRHSRLRRRLWCRADWSWSAPDCSRPPCAQMLWARGIA